jgi:hypothetical protein
MQLRPCSAEETTAAAAANKAWLEECVIHLLCVLALDRFGDYVSDQVRHHYALLASLQGRVVPAQAELRVGLPRHVCANRKRPEGTRAFLHQTCTSFHCICYVPSFGNDVKHPIFLSYTR